MVVENVRQRNDHTYLLHGATCTAHVTAKYTKVLSVAQQCVVGKFLSRATVQIILTYCVVQSPS